MSNQPPRYTPAGWGSTTLGQVSECILGGTPSTDVPQFWGGDVPWMASGDVHLRRINDVPGRITAHGLRSSNATLTSPPAVAVGLAGQGKTRGTVALTLCTLSTNQSIALLKANGSDLCTDYLFHNLDRRYEELRARSSGGGRGGLSKSILEAVPIELPPLREQQKIAQILDTLDIVIHETKTIIAKLTAVKLGLLHDLLTRGIDASGGLRPPQTEAPDLYKKTDQGWIPLGWDIRPLSEYTSSEITYGIVQAGPHVPNGVPYIRTGDMSGDSLSREAMLCTSRRIASSYARSEVRTGDIVMAIRATVGKVLPVPSDLDGANLTQGTAKVSPNARTDGAFLLWAIRHSRSQQAIQLQIKGTTFAEITLGALRQVPIAAPVEINEQREIGKRLAAIDMQLQSEQQYLAKAQAKKSGLMDDLLTGRIRVTPLLAEPVQQKGSA
ncbi:restriction endonuclease subunit S [Pseudomonas tolaasii]|uniref:restriction endonuclease subunit S n=1 Tax=Pseudomonas tolaasii TaxID=29442 RepID=UPI0030D07382